MTAAQYMSDEARRYYEGGRRVIRDGIPCRVAAMPRPAEHNRSKALLAIAHAVGCDFIDGRTRYFANPDRKEPPLVDDKPAPRQAYRYSLRPELKGRVHGFKPSRLDCPPMYHVGMAGDDPELTRARAKYAEGNPKPLREYLAKARQSAPERDSGPMARQQPESPKGPETAPEARQMPIRRRLPGEPAAPLPRRASGLLVMEAARVTERKRKAKR